MHFDTGPNLSKFVKFGNRRSETKSAPRGTKMVTFAKGCFQSSNLRKSEYQSRANGKLNMLIFICPKRELILKASYCCFISRQRTLRFSSAVGSGMMSCTSNCITDPYSTFLHSEGSLRSAR